MWDGVWSEAKGHVCLAGCQPLRGKVEGMQRPGEGCGTWVGSVLEIPALAHGRLMSVDEHRDFSEPVSSSARRGQYSPCQMVTQPRRPKPSVC